MKKKKFACVVLILAILVNSFVSPAFCSFNEGFRATLQLTAVQGGEPSAETVAQMQHIAELLSGYLSSHEYKFSRLYKITASNFFSSSNLFEAIIKAILNLINGARDYRNAGVITPGDSFFGGDYQSKLASDAEAKNYISNYTWKIKSTDGSFQITVSELAAPHTEYVCSSSSPTGGTATCEGTAPSDTIDIGAAFVKQ